ncbi:Probable inositol transporter 2 [Linum perenne]
MYYSLTIVQLAGFASNQAALLLSLVTAGLNALGSIVSIYFIDRIGRKKILLIYSLFGVAVSLGLLAGIFHETTTDSPKLLFCFIFQLLLGVCLIADDTVKDLCHGDSKETIYPLRFRGVCGGIPTTPNWISNIIVAQTFMSLTEAVGTDMTLLLFCYWFPLLDFRCVGIFWMYSLHLDVRVWRAKVGSYR